jgi:hypothetical protein
MRMIPVLLAASLLATATLSGCASVPVATTEQAPGADVRAYPSFAFFEPFDLEREGYSKRMGEDARAFLRREMEARGYRLDPENPGLRINLISAAAERSHEGPQISLGLGIGIGGGNTRGGIGVGLPISGGGTTERSRLPGALAIDVVDVQAKRVVWSGSVDVGRVSRNGEREALEAALGRMMATLPQR